jgi:NADH:ubiquinone oxidoreductase subunit F (NADH-binding)
MISETKLLTALNGTIDPLSISDYVNAGGYTALAKALHMKPEDIIEEIKKSGLRGRGGAGFPTWIKLKAVRDATSVKNKFVVCNADEGEPGTFKDKKLMEQNPHQLIEGIIIAALATNAERGYIYIRGEYGEAINKLKIAVNQAIQHNFLGQNILGSSFNFNLEVMPGAGSYLCGEEFTLLESLEGKRGNPRIKPPFPAEKGLWQEPTLVNNVETLSNLPHIINNGSAFFASMGTEKSKGTKLVCLSGDIVKSGVYELEMGCTINEIIHDLGGGLKNNETVSAVLLGGAAGTFANASQLNVSLCYEKLLEQNLTLGSGAIIVFGSSVSLEKILASILRFFKHESCGKCVPCRLGTYHLSREWEEAFGQTKEQKKQLLDALTTIAKQMAATSLCPLGQSPVLPLASALRNVSDLLV